MKNSKKKIENFLLNQFDIITLNLFINGTPSNFLADNFSLQHALMKLGYKLNEYNTVEKFESLRQEIKKKLEN